MQTKTQNKLLEHQFMMAREGGQSRIAIALLSTMSDQNNENWDTELLKLK
jgi:hypothetical protein